MKFDTLIIGGGLSGLTTGIILQKAGQNCAIVSSGQNAMHFFSGGFGLLSRLPDGTGVDEPLKAIPSLPATHPYSKIGIERIEKYTSEAKDLMDSIGLPLEGDASHNHNIISACGTPKKTWLSIKDIATTEDIKTENIHTALIVNIEGFLDFNTGFIAESLEKTGITCRITAISTDDIRQIRHNPSEMRSSNIAKLMEDDKARNLVCSAIKNSIKDEDCVILPAVFGLTDYSDVEEVRHKLEVPAFFLGTLPPSVPGIRSQMQMKRVFESDGGVFLMGDRVSGAGFAGQRVESVTTDNLEDIKVKADNYVLASGSYFGHGLLSNMDKVIEPVFGLDVSFSSDRSNWYNRNFFSKQEYLGFGVKTDGLFRGLKNGSPIENLYVSGSVLGEYNPLYEGSGAGVAIMTAFRISDMILGR